jgi:hypothetical protein
MHGGRSRKRSGILRVKAGARELSVRLRAKLGPPRNHGSPERGDYGRFTARRSLSDPGSVDVPISLSRSSYSLASNCVMSARVVMTSEVSLMLVELFNDSMRRLIIVIISGPSTAISLLAWMRSRRKRSHCVFCHLRTRGPPRFCQPLRRTAPPLPPGIIDLYLLKGQDDCVQMREFCPECCQNSGKVHKTSCDR